MKWINVKDRVPENYRDIIGYAFGSLTELDKRLGQKGHNYFIVYKDRYDDFNLSLTRETVNITHWALPEPPEDE